MKFICIIVLLLAVNPFCRSQYDIDSSLKVNGLKNLGKSFPDFNFKTTDSLQISKANLKGKVVFLNFWITECTPCIAEFNALKELYKKYQQYPDFVFLSLTYDFPNKINRMKARFEMPYRIASVKFPNLAPLKMGNGWPTSAIIDREGKIIYWVAGGHSDPERAAEFLKENAYPVLTRQLQQQ